jgi:hypothetical protein
MTPLRRSAHKNGVKLIRPDTDRSCRHDDKEYGTAFGSNEFPFLCAMPFSILRQFARCSSCIAWHCGSTLNGLFALGVF